MTPTSLARLLKPFEISPKNLRVGTTVAKGYERDSFADAWDRYLQKPSLTHVSGSRKLHALQVNNDAGKTQFLTSLQTIDVATAKVEDSPIFMQGVAAVAGHKSGMREDAKSAEMLVEELDL